MASTNMDISSPMPTKKEGIGAIFSSPTGVIDEVNNSYPHQVPHFAPNLDQSPEPQNKKFVQSATPVDIPGLADLPPLLGADPEDEKESDDEHLTRVASTFEEKEQRRQVKFCPWKQSQECCKEFRKRAYKLEKEEAESFLNRRANEIAQQQQEESCQARRIKMFRERAFLKQQEEARDFKNLSRIRREVRGLDNSARSKLFRKRLFDEAMED